MKRILKIAATLLGLILAMGIAPGHAATTPPSFSIYNASANENAGQICFAVRKHGSTSSSPSTVIFQTIAGTAKPITDYSPQSITLTFQPSETLKSECVPLVDDLVPEPTETFTARLTRGINSRIYDGTAIGMILDTDPTIPNPPPPAVQRIVTCQDVSVREDVGTAIVLCSITGSNGLETRLAYQTGGGMPTATAGADYTQLPYWMITIPADAQGFTFGVPIVNDVLAESAETFGTVITCVANCSVGHDAQVTIIDDDAVPPPLAGLARVKACPSPAIWGTHPDGSTADIGQLFKIDPVMQGSTPLRNDADLDYAPDYFRLAQPVDASGAPTSAPPIYIFEDCLSPL